MNVLLLRSLVTVAQMSTVRQIQTHQPFVRPHQGLVDLQVRRGTAQALDVDTPLLGVKVEGLESTPLACQLDGINVLVATVVSGTRVALGVLVGHGGPECVEDGPGSDIFRGDEDNGLALTLDLLFLRD